ncbi:MAG: DUF1549 domain-containing protein [Planctomycetota bacterium]
MAVNAEPGRATHDRLAVKRAAARIDALVEKALKEQGQQPAGIADAATFARRTYLALAGRIPTAAETQAYLNASSSEKYYGLVDELLSSRAHVSHEFNWWADLLRVKGRLTNRVSGEPYAHWLKQSLTDNKPYDEMVKEMLAAKGPVHARDNGATGYLMRDRNMPEDNMSNTIRLFLGSRVECAQCHNHPFDKWTQKQYFEMVAFTGGIRYQQRPQNDQKYRRIGEEAVKRWGRNGRRALFRTIQPLSMGIYGNGAGAVKLPKDYQYDDAKPMDWVEAHPIFAPAVRLDPKIPNEEELRRKFKGRRGSERRIKKIMQRARAPEIDSRTAFAAWMVADDNPRFATVIANRLWKRAFGRGLIEPVDDIKDDTKPVAPELMAELSRLVVELDYDMREFQRVLHYTRLWRRKAIVPADTPGHIADLRGPALRRMTAEQAWDSLLTLVSPDLDDRLRDPKSARAEDVYRQFESLSKMNDEQLLERVGVLVLRYTDRDAFRKKQGEMRRKQQAAQRAKKQKARPLYREYGRARKKGDIDRMAEIADQLEKLGLPVPGTRAGRAIRDTVRASDLPAPAPAGHLVRELGQSERDLIESSHTDPTVPQILALLNAFIEQRVLTNPRAAVMRDIDSARTAKSQVRAAFMAVLNRPPNAAERATWERDLARGGIRQTQDLVWTLINTHEFLFIQ